MRRWVYLGVAGAGLALLTATLTVWPFRLVYNPSTSVAPGWYWVQPQTQSADPTSRIQANTIVLVTLPPEARTLASDRGYLPAQVPLLKRVGAIAGQQVCVKDDFVFIDGHEAGRVLKQDRIGRALSAWSSCRALQTDELFLLSITDTASFDSRYFGPIRAAAVLGMAHPIWTRESP